MMPFAHYFRRGRRSYPLSKSQKFGFILVLTGFFLLLSVLLISKRFNPLLIRIAESAASDQVAALMNDSVKEVLVEMSVGYHDLVDLEKASDGTITALISNVSAINSLQANVSNAIHKKLTQTDSITLEIPFGNLLDSTIFSAKGPQIPVEVCSLSSVYSEFENNFSEAGINQTRHQLLLHLRVEMELLLPGVEESFSVSDTVVVAETVIVGEVPNSYLKFEQ